MSDPYRVPELHDVVVLRDRDGRQCRALVTAVQDPSYQHTALRVNIGGAGVTPLMSQAAAGWVPSAVLGGSVATWSWPA